MKTSNFIFFFLQLFAVVANGQVIYERTYPNAYPSNEFPVELSDSTTFSMSSKTICESMRIRHIDSLGQEVNENEFQVEAFSSGYHWIGHDSVLIWYEQGAWDVGPDTFHINLWTPGSITKLHATSAHYDHPPFRKYGAFLYKPDHFIFEKTDTLYLKNLLTSVVEDSIVISGITNIYELKESILIFRKSHLPRLIDRRLKTLYNWHTIVNFPFDTANAVVIDSFLVGKDNSNSTLLKMINVYDESIQQMDLSSYFTEIEDIQSNKGFLFVKGKSSSGFQVLQLDTDFQILKLSNLDIPDIDLPLALAYYPDRVYAWSLLSHSKYQANYRVCYAYHDPDPIQYLDISIDSAWLKSVLLKPYYAEIDIACQIRNLSEEPIRNFTFHYEEDYYCDNGVFSYQFEDLDIQPGDFDTVVYHSYSVDLAVGHKLMRRHFIEEPNHHLEKDTTNNDFQLVYLITEIQDLSVSNILFYPNPFNDAINISSGLGGIELKLYNQMGHLVSSGIDQLDHLSELPVGIYFLQVQDGQQLMVRKVVKVE